MPRNGSGVYEADWVDATPNTTIESGKVNAMVDDLVVDANAARPITAGGSAATTAVGAADAFSTKGTNIASATTTDIGAATGRYVHITGTTTITGLGTKTAGVEREVVFDGILTLTHNATSLILPGAANITTAAGDAAVFVSEGSGNWRCIAYQRASGAALVVASPAVATMDTRRNRIVNGDMKDSQENGNTSATTNGYYAADQFATYRVTSAGVITSQRVASVSPAGSPYRYRVTITTADASLAAGEYLTISQNLEGSNVADFQYGSASAKASVDRFGFKGPAGTYAVAYHNSAANRSFVGLFTISAGQANTDTVQEIAVPGDTTGTWLTADGVIGITRDVVLACGSTFQGVAGWQAGNILGTSAVSNGMGTAAAVFELFDVGIKLDPDATGVYGAYEVAEVDAVYRSERYLPCFTSAGIEDAIGTGQAYATTGVYAAFPFLIEACKPPTGVVVSSYAHLSATAGASAFVASSGAFSQASKRAARVAVSGLPASFTVGHAATVFFNNASGKVIFTGSRL